MRAVVFDNELKLDKNYVKPSPKGNEALIKTKMVGICNTDYEITLGYMGYKGVIGHEFVGIVEECADKSLIGKRVVGDINCGCGECEWCKKDLHRHCPNRQTLGIWQKDGCFSDYFTLPVNNLLEVPENVSVEEAVFTEPLAAALEILEQVKIQPIQKVLVLGDGKLGIIIALALNASGLDVTLVGKHKDKLAIAQKQGVKTSLLDEIEVKKEWDFVVEATGSITGFETSISLVKPRGTLILKSTIVASKEFNFSSLVVDEVTIVGSRCGRFQPALRMLEQKRIDLKPLISEIFDVENVIEAFESNKRKDTVKILVKF
ncbi:alcohol dehydrogenase catalytic domain-containing protein [bacterium]|nr:alcohol dehydrogenase catalytic domain-containing protein [bacterium]